MTLPLLGSVFATCAFAQPAETPAYLRDRGDGLPTSLFGTYIRRAELLVYPFYEYEKNTADEYEPFELGFPGAGEFLGESKENELVLFVAYGFTDRLALEIEGALHADATFEKARDDPSTQWQRLEESGLGEIETNLRYRWREETDDRPELFSYLEIAYPFQRDDLLIGAQDWEIGAGVGWIKGRPWGTILGRVSLVYDGEESKFELGEYAVEYLKKISSEWSFVAALEGEDDEIAVIGEGQWFFGRRAFLKFNAGFGLTEKAPDFAPEVGVMFRLGR
ncbi:MAG TPA: hypothetical protein VIM81_03635 [Gammaproteobacteria bacterium]